jgi:hypothetical protein
MDSIGSVKNIGIYPSLDEFPSNPEIGQIAIARDTNFLYKYNTSWDVLVTNLYDINIYETDTPIFKIKYSDTLTSNEYELN